MAGVSVNHVEVSMEKSTFARICDIFKKNDYFLLLSIRLKNHTKLSKIFGKSEHICFKLVQLSEFIYLIIGY